MVEEGGFIDLSRKRLRLLRGRGSGVGLVPQAEIIYEPDAGRFFLANGDILKLVIRPNYLYK